MEVAVWYLGRLLFGGFFLYSAYGHFTRLEAMTGYAKYKGVSSPRAAVLVTGVLLLIGGISIVFNVYTTIGLLALVLFFVPVSLKMHAFWTIEDPNQKMQEGVQFRKNMALLGAVLILLAHTAFSS